MNKNIIFAIVVVLILVAAGWYYYTTMMTMDSESANNVSEEMNSVVKSDAIIDQSTQPQDISTSIDNVDMEALNAQINADLKGM